MSTTGGGKTAVGQQQTEHLKLTSTGASASGAVKKRRTSSSSSSSSINSENLYKHNLTAGQLFKRSVLSNILLWSTICAVIVGIIIGVCMRKSTPIGGYSSHTVQLVAFPGEMFLRMLKMLILPLIIASVISALASLDSSVSGKIGVRACLFYLATTIIATVTGIILVTLIHPGDISKRSRSSLMQAATGEGDESPSAVSARGSSFDALLDLIRSLVPDNIVSACFQHTSSIYVNKTKRIVDSSGVLTEQRILVREIEHKEGANVLGLMFFCCIFGAILSSLGKKAEILLQFFQALDATVMKMIMLAMYFSPIGVMSLIVEKCITIDDMSKTLSLVGWYMVTVIIGLLIHGFVSVPAMYAIWARKDPLKFMKQCSECIVFALSTGSSTATLPVTFKCLEENVRCDTRITRFVLPIGATINMDGTALYEAVAAIFIGQMNGMTFTFPDLIIISLTSTAASFGAAAVPSAGLVTMIMVLTAVGLPVKDITMIVAVDWFLDRLRTAVNVLGDAYVCGIVATMSKGELEKYDANRELNPDLEPPIPVEQMQVALEMQPKHQRSGAV